MVRGSNTALHCAKNGLDFYFGHRNGEDTCKVDAVMGLQDMK